MIFESLPLKDAYRVKLEKREDDRGFFARTFCVDEFQNQTLATQFVQCNTSYNHKAGTLRGLHFQYPPYMETKLVRCIVGEIFDVLVDLRPNSPTYKQWYGERLTQENRIALYVPRGFAHGYQALTDGCEVFYMVDNVYSAPHAMSLAYNDPDIGVSWPMKDVILSNQDEKAPNLRTFESKLAELAF